LAYDQLKSAIYRLEKEVVYEPNEPQATGQSDLESAGLLRRSQNKDDNGNPTEESPAVRIFTALLDGELEKIDSFYREEQDKLLQEVDSLLKDVENVEQSDWQTYENMEDGGSDADSDDGEGGTIARRSKFTKGLTEWLPGQKPSLKKRRKSDFGSTLNRRRRPSSASRASGERPEDELPGMDEPIIEEQMDEDERQQAGLDQKIQHPQSSSKIETPDRMNRRLSISEASHTVWNSTSDWATDTKITFKLRIQNLFREISQLMQFSTLNQTGFKKICKKWVVVNRLVQSD